RVASALSLGRSISGLEQGGGPCETGGFFIFLFFIFVFYKNIFSAVGSWSPRCGAAGAFVQKLLHTGPWGPVARQRGCRPPRPSGRGAAGPGRPAAGRPALPPLCKGW